MLKPAIRGDKQEKLPWFNPRKIGKMGQVIILKI